MTDFRVSVCAGQGFRIPPIVRKYRRPDLLTDPFLDDEPLECGLEDPEVCESCQ